MAFSIPEEGIQTNRRAAQWGIEPISAGEIGGAGGGGDAVPGPGRADAGRMARLGASAFMAQGGHGFLRLAEAAALAGFGPPFGEPGEG